MSNVEYKCPQCGSRLFAAPGGTRLRCPRDDVRYEQTEFHGGGEVFEFKDEDGQVHVPNEFERKLAELKEDHDEAGMRTLLLEEYRRLAGTKADGRWALDTLLEETQKLRAAQSPISIDTTADPNRQTTDDNSEETV